MSIFKKIYNKLTGHTRTPAPPVRVNKHYIKELQKLNRMDLVELGTDGDYWTDDALLRYVINMNEIYIRLPDEQIDPSIHNSHLMDMLRRIPEDARTEQGD